LANASFFREGKKDRFTFVLATVSRFLVPCRLCNHPATAAAAAGAGTAACAYKTICRVPDFRIAERTLGGWSGLILRCIPTL